MQTHYFGVDSATDLGPADAVKVANVPGARRGVEINLGLHPVAADQFQTFDLPDGTKLEQNDIGQGRSCQWPYTSPVSAYHKGNMMAKWALFVPLERPKLIMLEHDCQGVGGLDQVTLKFVQPLLEAIYGPAGSLFVRCAGGLSTPCSGAPRLLHHTEGGLGDIHRMFNITAAPAGEIIAAYAKLSEGVMQAQQAIDTAEAAIIHAESNTARLP